MTAGTIFELNKSGAVGIGVWPFVAPALRTIILRPGSFGPKDLGSLQRCPKQCELQGSFAPLNNVRAQDHRRNASVAFPPGTALRCAVLPVARRGVDWRLLYG